MDAARQVFKKHRRARRRQPGKQGRLFRGSGRRYRRCGYRQELNDSSEPARKGCGWPRPRGQQRQLGNTRERGPSRRRRRRGPRLLLRRRQGEGGSSQGGASPPRVALVLSAARPAASTAAAKSAAAKKDRWSAEGRCSSSSGASSGGGKRASHERRAGGSPDDRPRPSSPSSPRGEGRGGSSQGRAAESARPDRAASAISSRARART